LEIINVKTIEEDIVIVKKYLINVDFPNGRIHLNPNFFGGMWCKLDEDTKMENRGKSYATTQEVRDYLNNKKTLHFKGKIVKNISICLNCSRRKPQSVYWDI